MSNTSKFKRGIKLEDSSTALTEQGEMRNDAGAIKYHTGSGEQTVIDTSSAQALSNKDIDGGTASNTLRITAPKADRATLDALTRKEATLVFDTDNKKLLVDDGTSLLETGGGDGSTGIDYITKGDGEDLNSASDWTQYANTVAGTTPDDFGGTASGNVTLTRTTTAAEILRGTASLKLNKTSAADEQGEGVYTSLTLDNADLHSILRVKMNTISSANYADGDIRVYLVSSSDSFAANFNVIEPAPTELLAGSSGIGIFEFQTDATDTEYRLCLHVSSTNATAYDVSFEVSLGPDAASTSVPLSDWEDATSAFTLTNLPQTTFRVKRRRVGDSYEIDMFVSASGAATGDITLTCDDFTIDESKLGRESDNSFNNVGYVFANDRGSNRNYTGSAIVLNGSTTDIKFTGPYGLDDVGQWDATYPFTWASPDELMARITVPVSGFGSTVNVSDPDATRQVRASAFRDTSTQTITAGTYAAIIFNNEKEDSHSAFNPSTGVFTAPYSGRFSLTANARITNGATAPDRVQMGFGIDGETDPTVGRWRDENNLANDSYSANISADVTLNKGQTVEVLIRSITQNVTVENTAAALEITAFHVTSYPGGQQIAASETVAFSSIGHLGGTVAAAASANVQYRGAGGTGTSFVDTHNAYDDTTHLYTVPVSGRYQVSASVNADKTTGETIQMIVDIDVVTTFTVDHTFVGTTDENVNVPAAIFDLVAGQTISINASNSAGADFDITASNSKGHFTVHKI